MNYLHNADGKIIGRYEEKGTKRIVYAEDRYIQLGYYDTKDDRTYDAYGNCVANGDTTADLPYYLHEIHFPLPDIERVRFTNYRIKRATAPKMIYSDLQDAYWDNGRCEICKKSHRTCRISGFPSMCETCYRFMKLYGNTDALDLARESKRHAIPIEKFQKAVEMTKAPYLAEAKAAEAELRKIAIQGIKDAVLSGTEMLVENSRHQAATQENAATKPHVQSLASTRTSQGKKKRKRKISFLGWIVIIFFGIQAVKILAALVGYAIIRVYVGI